MDSIVRNLRQRAADMRRLATAIDGATVRSLASCAGSDTWVSDAADAYRMRLVEFRIDLDGAATELRDQAILLERQAAQREADVVAAAADAALSTNDATS